MTEEEFQTIQSILSKYDEFMLVRKDRFEELIEESHFLMALRGCGVDSWEGYERAQQQFEELNGEE